MKHFLTGLYEEFEGWGVHYGQVPLALHPEGWGGIVYFIETINGIQDVKEAVDHICNQLVEKSYDHGSYWRETRRELIQEDQFCRTTLVSFRVRDSY